MATSCVAAAGKGNFWVVSHRKMDHDALSWSGPFFSALQTSFEGAQQFAKINANEEEEYHIHAGEARVNGHLLAASTQPHDSSPLEAQMVIQKFADRICTHLSA